MISSEPNKPSLSRQCKLINISRSSLYYKARGESQETLGLMRKIDKLYTAHPFFGSRQMVKKLAMEGTKVSRHRVRRLMRLMGFDAIYQKPNTSKPHPGHKIYPYLLRDLTIMRANHVWCTDITYIPVQGGFFYLVAIMDWATRKVLAWKLSNTMHADFCVEALKEAMAQYGKPEIFNTDQGSQFTSTEFTSVLLEAGIKISMDGRGRYMDNIFIERLWRSLKYECIFLNEITGGSHAKQLIGDWIDFYNDERPHTALDGRTPSMAYGNQMTPDPAATPPRPKGLDGSEQDQVCRAEQTLKQAA